MYVWVYSRVNSVQNRSSRCQPNVWGSRLELEGSHRRRNAVLMLTLQIDDQAPAMAVHVRLYEDVGCGKVGSQIVMVGATYSLATFERRGDVPLPAAKKMPRERSTCPLSHVMQHLLEYTAMESRDKLHLQSSWYNTNRFSFTMLHIVQVFGQPVSPCQMQRGVFCAQTTQQKAKKVLVYKKSLQVRRAYQAGKMGIIGSSENCLRTCRAYHLPYRPCHRLAQLVPSLLPPPRWRPQWYQGERQLRWHPSDQS